jgi:ABC-type transporter Mla maintaining outer membrane lipid asymmetry permease subunit MlaE
MAKKANLAPELRRRKRTIGIIAVVLLLIFTILALLQYISLIEWLIADLVVGLVANLLLRRIGMVIL